MVSMGIDGATIMVLTNWAVLLSKFPRLQGALLLFPKDKEDINLFI